MTGIRTALFMLLLPAPGFGQDVLATLQGFVCDSSGAPVEGSEIQLQSPERSYDVPLRSNHAGRFVATRLTPGPYRLTVRKSGFRTVIRDGIVLRASTVAEIEISLEVGERNDSITISDKISELDTQTATRTGSIGAILLDNVPAGGRNPFALEYSVPGVVKTSTYWGSMELYATSNVNAVQIGGGRSGENETLVEGVPATRADRGIAYVAPLAAVDELTVHTNVFDPQYGRTGGGINSVSLKSGTGTFHGQLYEFLKNDKLRANDWVANKNGQPNTPFKNNTFGFEVDGPVRIPELLGSRMRAFFLLSFEGLREHTSGGTVTTVPTEAMKTGDFSRLLTGGGSQVVIYDPLTTALQSTGQYTRQAFAGNLIPPSRMNPVAVKLASFYPQANLTAGPDGLNNYSKVQPSTNSYDSWLGKYDLQIAERNHISFRYGQTPWQTFSGLVWGDNAAEPSTSYPATRVERTGGIDWVHTSPSSLVFALRIGLARYEAYRGNTFGANFDPQSLGFPADFVKQLSSLEFPRFTLGNYSDLGANGVRSYETHDTWSAAPVVSKVTGRHLVRVGAEYRIYRDNMLQPGTASGQFGFNKSWTQANALRADAGSGNEFASFLLGYPASGSVPLNIDPALQSRYYALFAADDFRISSRLTVSYGLREDYETPYVERYNRMISGFAFGQPSPIAGQVAGLPLTGGPLFAGQGGSRYPFDPKPWNLQPRLGLAWHVASGWVLRGGYGLTALGQSSSGSQSLFSQTTTMITSLDGNLTPAASLSNPYPSSLFPNGLQKAVGNSLGLATNLGQSITAPYRDRPLPYSHQYSVDIQRELPGHWLLDAAYQGNLTRRLPVSLGLNFIPLATLNSIPVDQRAAYFTAAVPNPMAGLLPGSSLNAATIPRQQLLFAYPQYTGVTVTDVPIGKQRYDGLLVRLSQRLSYGLTLTVSFAAPKTLEQVSVLNAQDVDLSNLLNTKLEKRLAQFDVSRQFSVIGSWDVPFRSRWKPASRVAGGWTISAFFMSHSGYPLDFPNAAPLAARSAKLTDAQRDAAARAAGRQQFDVSYDKWYDVTLFPQTAGPAPFTLRTFPTRFPDVRSKPLNVVDLSVHKEIRLSDKLKWQIRVDAHNAGNFPWFASGLSNNVTNAGFGQLKADIGNETRTVVAIMKIIF